MVGKGANGSAASAFTRVHSASKTRVNALVDALWRGPMTGSAKSGAAARHAFPGCFATCGLRRSVPDGHSALMSAARAVSVQVLISAAMVR